jgi:IS4 transposase
MLGIYLPVCQIWRQLLTIHRLRWGIEMMFKDCKTGGYNLEDTQVNEERFLALLVLVVIAYSLATLAGAFLEDV